MAFYYLNRIPKKFSKTDIENICKKFGNLKFVGDIRSDRKDSKLNATIAVFHDLSDEEGLLSYCKKEGIYPIKKKEENRGNTKGKVHKKSQEKSSNIVIYNPSFFFYKDKAYGENIEAFQLQNRYESLFSIDNTQTFDLTTIYPGLLVGSGYNHPKLKDDIEGYQLGFFFDHTTGLPLISGSSIKGVLRSVLENEKFCKDVYQIDNSKQLVENYFQKSKIVFYDAFIIQTNNKDKKIFASDYITSHRSDEKNGMFKNPNPIKFLKILPEVTFRFQFAFPNDEVSSYIELFKEIIVDFGLGAKTNTGYGKFQE